MRLENQLERQLDLTWAVCLTSDCSERATVKTPIGAAELHAIEGIEHLGAELNIPFAFVEVVILEQRQVEVLLTILPQVWPHAGRIAKNEGGGQREISRVEPFQQLIGFAGVKV